MKTNKQKTIGIIGGIGPWATVDLEQKILKLANADKDQDYPRIISFNNSQIPDRTEALLGNGPSPVPEIVKTAQTLLNAGAEVLCMPCNTAHAYIDDITWQLGHAKIVNLISEVVAFIQKNYPLAKRIGLLVSTGSRKSNVYDKILLENGLVPIHLSDESQESLMMDAVYGPEGIKADNTEQPRLLLEEAAKELAQQGADLIVMGCTEIPLVLKNSPVPLVDGNEVLATAIMREIRN